MTALLSTYFVMASLTILGAAVLLHGELCNSPVNFLTALCTIAALLVLVITCGVSVTGLSSNTVVSIAIVWIALYGCGFPASRICPNRILRPTAFSRTCRTYFAACMTAALVT